MEISKDILDKIVDISKKLAELNAEIEKETAGELSIIHLSICDPHKPSILLHGKKAEDFLPEVSRNSEEGIIFKELEVDGVKLQAVHHESKPGA